MLDLTALENLPPLREVIRAHDLGAKKSLGQNFLLDLNLTRKIARAGQLTPDMHVIEIGPGPGGLTRAILEQDIQHLTAIERDDRAVRALADVIKASNGRLDIISDDALEVDLTLIGNTPRAIVANLPYNIATPLLINWLQQYDQFASMTLMFQKEVAERITGQPNSKAYGRLAVIAQWLCDVKIAFDLPASAFVPPPKVTSSVVHFVPKTPEKDAPQFKTVEHMTALAFGQRRKMLRQSLKSWVADIRGFLKSLDIDETLRADVVTVDQYITMARTFERLS